MRTNAFAVLVSLLSLLVVVPAGAAVLTEFPLTAGSKPHALTTGPDGNIWFTEWGRDKIAKITPAGVVTEYATSAGCAPWGITLAMDANIWFTCYYAPRIGRVEITGNVNEYSVGAQPEGPIAAGQTGLLWYSLMSGGVGVFGTNLVNYTPPPDATNYFGVAFGGDNRMWLAGGYANTVFRYNNGGGTDTTPVPTPASRPFLVAWCQATGAAWFSERDANKLLRVTPGLVMTEFPLPTPNGAPSGISCGADGSVWYALPSANRVGRRKTDGTFQEFVVPTAASDPFDITTGPDGSIWFSENTGDKIGRVQLRPQGDTNGSGDVTAADIYYLINYLFAGGPRPVP